MKKRLLILVFLIILISSVSIVSAAYIDVKPAKETKLKDSGIRFTLPFNAAKPQNLNDYLEDKYTLNIYNGKIEVFNYRLRDHTYVTINGSYSKPVTKVVLHLENQSFTSKGNKNLNSFTYPLFPKVSKNFLGYQFKEKIDVYTNATQIGGTKYMGGAYGRNPGNYLDIETGTIVFFSKPATYSSYANLVAVDLYFAKEGGFSSNNRADLTISKVTKKGNTHTVFMKNIGKKVAGKSVLGVYEGNKLIKKVNVKAIAKGKTVQVNVPLNAKFKNKVKTFKVDYNNKIKESNKNNNIRRVI